MLRACWTLNDGPLSTPKRDPLEHLFCFLSTARASFVASGTHLRTLKRVGPGGLPETQAEKALHPGQPEPSPWRWPLPTPPLARVLFAWKSPRPATGRMRSDFGRLQSNLTLSLPWMGHKKRPNLLAATKMVLPKVVKVPELRK